MDEREFESAIRRLQERMYRTAVSILWNDEDAADTIQEAILRGRIYEGRWRLRVLLEEAET